MQLLHQVYFVGTCEPLFYATAPAPSRRCFLRSPSDLLSTTKGVVFLLPRRQDLVCQVPAQLDLDAHFGLCIKSGRCGYYSIEPEHIQTGSTS